MRGAMPYDKRTIAVYDAKVKDYRAAFSENGIDPALSRFMDAVPKSGTILDLGCGPGKHAKILSDHGFNVTAMDASYGMVDAARALGGFTVHQASFDDLNAADYYDGIWANFSLLHAPREAFPQHIKAIAKALKPQGLFHIGMKIGEGAHRDGLGRFYHFYQRDALCETLIQAGFSIRHEKRGEGKGLAGTIDPWIEILAQKP